MGSKMAHLWTWLLVIQGAAVIWAKQTHGAELLQKPFATKSALPSCDFDDAEHPLCGWTQSEDDGGQWLRGDGPRPGQSPGPPGGKPERRGYYIYPEAGETVQLQSPALDPDAAEICVEFLYYLYSLSTSAQLAVKVQDASGNASTLWTKGGMQSSSWLLGTVTVQNPVRRPFQVVFAATRAETTEIDMGLDSISIRVGPCSPCVTGCDFDSLGDLCGWENPAEGDIQWEQWTGAGDDPDVGPADDFSKPGFGSYMLLDSFDSKNSGTALLKSPPYESQGGCLSLNFYYTLHGVSSDTTLKVYAAAVTGGGLGAPLLTLSGEHGPNWNPGVVNYTGTAEVQFVFEGTYRGKPGLAVDSIHVSPCEEVFTQCDFNDNANPFCGWVGSGDNDDVSWTRTNHSTPTEETGPPGDYPDGKGYYIYAEGGSLKPGQSLRLTSRAFCTNTEACVEFYYYMYGIVEVQTQLRVLLEGPSGAEVTLWTRSGIQSPAWLLGSVTVPYGGPQPSRVLFEVVRGSHPYLDVSLDNISVRRGPCSGSGTPLPPTTSSIATSTHAGPVVTLPPGSPVTSRSTTASPVPTSHVVPTTHSNTTPQKPTLTSPTTTTTASISTATTRDSHVSSTAPATSSQGSQTTPGVPKPTSHPTSETPSTSKASTTSTTASHGSTTTTPTPTTSISKTSTTSTTTSQGDTTTTPTPTTSVSKTSTASTTASHGSTTTTATITTSESKTTTTSTTASHGSTTTTPTPTTSISKTSTTSTTGSHGSTTTTATITTSDSKTTMTSTTAIHSTPAPTTSISKTSTTSTTASHSNTTTTSSTQHTQLPITSQTSTTHGSTTSTTPAPTSQGNLTTKTTSPATISTTSDSKTSTTSTTAAQGSTTVATSPSTTRGPTQLPITSPTSGSQPSTTTGHTSHVPTAGSSSTSHPSVTTARPTPPKSSTTATTHISPSTSPSHNQTSTTQGSQSPGHTTAAPSTTRQTPPITTSSATTKVTTISTTTISSSPTTHTAGQPTTTSGTTLQANTTITQSATTLTTSPHTSPTTLAPDSLTSRPPSPTVSRTTTLGKTTTTAPLMTSSVSPSTLHMTTVGHVTTTSITASTKSTPTTPGSGHTSPSTTHTIATTIAITTTTGSSASSLTTTTRPPIRTTTTQHTTSLATIESSRTTVTTTERSSTKMPVSPEATTTTTLPTTTAKPTPTQGVSIGTTVTSTAPVAPPGQGICTISGDPHYTTYDGRLFHFMGTCTYLLSSVCNATAGLPTFRVQATNEHRGANKQVSYVKSVSVEVYGTEIVLLKARRVTVNGQRVTLPVSLAEDRVWVRLSGTFVLVQTDFGLSVRFDGNHHAEVSVPPSYYGYLCGLCGNYNGEVSDDNLMPDGTSAGTDADKLGESWQVPDAGDEGCSNTGDPGECDKDLAAEAEKPSSCGILTDPQGPFSPCHSKIPPEGFFESCVYDFCGTGGDEGTLCFALQSYADRCAQAGVNIAWRNSSFCPLSCPPGSSYSPCAPACPATCLDGPSEPSCSSLPCLEGCVCNEGLVLSGETCVPIDQCGCTDTSGQYHPVGESWMADSNCTERCTCGAQNNITCQEWSCSPIQECRPQEGLLGCQDTGVAACHVAGDPHYYTCDGTMVSFMGTCTYTLVALCQSDPRLPSFTITAKNEERGQPEASYLRQVTLQLHGYTVTLQKSRRVLIDGQRVRTPVEGRIPGVSITSSGIYVILETDFGLVMKFDGNHHLEIQLPGTYFDKVCGMCGNFNNQSRDDLLMPNGHLAANDSQFGNSWKAPGDADPGCQPDDREDLEPHCSPAEMERLSALCGEILGPKYQPCHGVINPQLFVQNCLFDLCEYDGMASVLCDNVQSYVEACKSQGVTGLSWRNSTFCPLPCPPHSHYTECASPCPATCCNLYAPAACQSRTTCVEGCTCDRGYVLSDDTCVSARDCGCLDSQHEYHSPGDTWVTLNCREHCTCLGSGEISCRAFECLSGSTCALSSSGQRFCKPGDFHQCVISGDPHYRTFDRFVHHFQGRSTYTLSRTLPSLPSVLVPFSVAGRNRRRFPFHRFSFLREVYVSVYDYSITFMQRRKLVVNGLAVTPPFATPDGALRISQWGLRILLQTDFGFAVSSCLEHLSVNGLAVIPPFATPDGTLRISQRGLRILLQTDFGLAVNGLAVIPPFATPDETLRISQRGLRILLQTDFELVVSSCLEHLSVNGLAVTPPFVTPDGALRISQRGLRILLQTDFGLAVSFDGRDFAEITLPSTYQNRVGGLCGNYDGRRNNEYMRPDGTWTRSLNTFGNSWQVSVQRETKAGIRTRDRREEPSEDDDVETGFDITCSPEQLMFVNGTDMCGALSDPVGPFSACHSKVSPDTFQESCVYDLCALFNDTELLCQDYEAYAQLCQEERVPLETWRRQTGCEVSCPPHTTYQPCMTACPASCANMAAPSDCESPCMEGCASNTGYVLSGLDSVPYNQCGCTRNDQYYQINDSFWTEDCSQHCVCRNTGTLECQEAGCAPGEACALANFTRGCFQMTPCLSSPCQNEGTCVDESEGFLCLCPEGYFGPQCEEALQDEAPTTAPPLRPTTSSPPTGEEAASQLVPILLGVLIPLGIILIVTAIVCICRHRNRKKAKEDRIAVLSAPGQPSTSDAFGNRITRF